MPEYENYVKHWETESIVREMTRFKMSEMRWIGSERLHSDGITVLYSGRQDDIDTERVGILLYIKAAQAL